MNERFVELKQNFLPRFWDTGNKCMIYPEYDEKLGIYYCCKDNILPHNHPFDYSLLDISAILLCSRFNKMNPTGLKDKNGKLIYEGDILKYKGTVKYGWYLLELGEGYYHQSCDIFGWYIDNGVEQSPLEIIKYDENYGPDVQNGDNRYQIIGIEKDLKYHRVATERVEREQHNLFNL